MKTHRKTKRKNEATKYEMKKAIQTTLTALKKQRKSDKMNKL